MHSLSIEQLGQAQLKRAIESIAQLRITVFREYPYLYDGALEYERRYLHKFAETSHSLIIVLKDHEKIVGAITGLPLKEESDTVKAPWATSHRQIDTIYYFSEILLLPAYRHHGWGTQLFERAEGYVKQLNCYQQIALATVVRPEAHPAKPSGYRSLSRFWQARGYQMEPERICHISWKELGEQSESEKPLVFWTKRLA